ncbi:MAG: response regulator [Myxococcota bacterium]
MGTDLGGLRVLVVDDEPDAREILTLILRTGCAEVAAAGDVACALELVERFAPHVIVSDIGLPREDGYSFIRKVRALPKERGGEVAAVAVTAFCRPQDCARALAAGFQRHLAKPIEPAHLLEVVAALAGRPASR